MEHQLELAIVGAGGLLAEALLARLAEHPWLSGRVVLLGTDDTLGQVVEFGSEELVVDELSSFDFNQVQFVIDTGDEEREKSWMERARNAGCILLTRMPFGGWANGTTPVVARVNPQPLAAIAETRLVKLPHAAAIQLATLLKPVSDNLGLRRVTVFSSHAVSDLGCAGVEELARQTAQLLNGKPVKPLLFPAQIAFNLVPWNGKPLIAGTTGLEQQIQDETLQVLGLPELELSLTCNRSPVFFGHSQAISLHTSKPSSVTELQRLWADFPDIEVIKASDSPPSAVTHASGRDKLTIGRIRSSRQNKTEFSLWAVADNLQFGHAGNLVRILEVLVKAFL